MSLSMIVYAMFIVAMAADVWTTKRGLNAGLHEANPVINFLMSKLGDNGWVAIKVSLSVVLGAYLMFIDAPLMLGALAIITGAVAFRNYRITPK